MSALISTDELATLLHKGGVVVLDGSWYMPSEKRDARREFATGHIPTARFFDIDAISDTSSPYPHMLAPVASFEKAAGSLGISNDSRVVVYDGSGLFSAARVWWMLRVFGHDHVKVLDGGLPKWKAEGRLLEAGIPAITASTFKAHFRPQLLRIFDAIQHNVAAAAEMVIDARSSGRFNGTEPEPRAGLRSGHIPGSINVPFRECTTPPFHTMRPVEELKALFAAKGISPQQPVVASCGSGVTACVLALALHELGNTNVAVYDGAWAEWASRTA